MGWAAIGALRKPQIGFESNKMNLAEYKDLLNLMPIINRVFQKNDASIQWNSSVFLQIKLTEFLDKPAISPDLNHMVNL